MNSPFINALRRQVALLAFAAPLCLAAFGTAHAGVVVVSKKAVQAEQPIDGPQIKLPTGTIVGTETAEPRPLRTFLGIPYAAPPIDALRWQAPQAVARWAGVRNTTRFGPRCMQHASTDRTFRSTRMSEDCLYLNVWAPAMNEREQRPVLVYFHGGDLNEGDASESRYDGAFLGALGVVTVTVNYRLGLFGFLAMPAAGGETAHDSAGNYGLLDQLAALRWVRDNIALFGGDPAKVTIAGDFGGAVAVSAHMASPQSRGLFARAIAHSGGAFARQAVWSRTRAEQVGVRFATQVGARTLPQLRAMPVARLMAATGSARDRKFAFWPHVDGEFLTGTPEAVFASGGQARVPLLLGNRTSEPHFSAVLSEPEPTPANWKQTLARVFGEQTEQAASHYPGSDNDEVIRSASVLAADLSVGHATWRWMSLHRRTGGDAPVYFYAYDRTAPSVVGSSEQGGASGEASSVSSAESALGNLNLLPQRGWETDDYRASGMLLRYVLQFIKVGNPNGPRENPLRYFSALHWGGPARLPSWPAVREEGGALARQAIDVEPKTSWDRSAGRHDFIERFLASRASGGDAR